MRSFFGTYYVDKMIVITFIIVLPADVLEEVVEGALPQGGPHRHRQVHPIVQAVPSPQLIYYYIYPYIV